MLKPELDLIDNYFKERKQEEQSVHVQILED